VSTGFLGQFLKSVGSPLLREDSVRVLLRLAAWQGLAVDPNAAAALPPVAQRAAIGPLDGGQLREVFAALAASEELGDRRRAFQDATQISYELLNNAALTDARDHFYNLLLRLPERRQEVADELVQVAEQTLEDIGWLPAEVADFVTQCSGVGVGTRVLCVGSVVDGLAMAAMRAGVAPHVRASRIPVLAATYACLCGFSLTITTADPLQDTAATLEPSSEFDVVLSAPPWGARRDPDAVKWYASRFGLRRSEAFGIERALELTTRSAAVIVPLFTLFAEGPERRLREYLVENGYVRAVIEFPRNLLTGLSLPFAVLLLDKGDSRDTVVFCQVDEKTHLSGQGKLRARNRRFVGGQALLQKLTSPDGHECCSAPKARIAEADYVLQASRYLNADAQKLPARPDATVVELGSVVEIIKPQWLPSEEGGEGIEIGEVSASEMPLHRPLTKSLRVRTVSAAMLKRRMRQALLSGDLLLSTRGALGTVGLVGKLEPGRILVPALSCVVLRLLPASPIKDSRALLMYLRAPRVQARLHSLAVGSSVLSVSIPDLRRFEIEVPTADAQAALVGAWREQEIAQESIDRLVDAQGVVARRTWEALSLA
jgi:type I restriction enzyme M protein